MKAWDAFQEVNTEYEWATKHFPPFASAHEGLAVIMEEFEELKAEVFKNPKTRSQEAMKNEARQVAAMAIRFMADVTLPVSGCSR